MPTELQSHRASTPFETIARRIARVSVALLLFFALAIGVRYLLVTNSLKACFATNSGTYTASYNSLSRTSSSVEFTIPKSLDLNLPGVREVGVALGTVQAISLQGSNASEIAAAVYLPGLKQLSIGHPKCSASEVHWARLGSHPLEEVTLDNTGLTGESLLALAGRRKIKKLSLFDEQNLSLAGVKRVAELNDLFELRIHGTPATSSEWRELFEAVPSLVVLSVSSTTLDDAAITPLRQQTGLTFLQLFQTQISLKGLESLPPPQTLTYLFMDGLRAGGGSVETLLKYNRLTTLELHRAELTSTEKTQLSAGLARNAGGAGCRVSISTLDEIAQQAQELRLEEARAAAVTR